MSSIFTKIINGDIPSYKIAENEFCFAILDINPKQKGHTLVFPKVEVDKIYELDDRNYEELFKFSQQISKAIDKCNWGSRVGFIVEGLEVPHCHIHLIPISKSGDLHSRTKPISVDEMKEIQKEIIKNL